MFDFDIEALGFTEVDIEAIGNHFSCSSLSYEDWESMELFENDEVIFEYLFIDNQEKESIINTLLEMGKISVEDLDEGQSLMEYMIEDDEYFKLPNGRWVRFTDELLRKDKMAQID